MKKLSIGIVCYPSVGGSGVVATQLGQALALLGHKVHFISYDPPFKWKADQKNTFFHQVQINEYVLFKYPDYTLPLAVKIVEVSKKYRLDILHVHYAVPHATAALLAKDIAKEERIPFPHVVTTLHGTDITLLARDKNIMPVIKYSIESSCGVTAVSESLKRDTEKVLGSKKIEVIHNFYSPKKPTKSRRVMRKNLGVKDTDFLAIHLSNMRPVKRIPDLLTIMALVKNEPRIKLLLLAGGNVEQYEPLIKKLGIGKQLIVRKNILDIENYISASDVGIYTSEDESFGMGILETMAYGKPVLSTNVGGISEFMQDAKTGFLFKLGDTKGFAKKLVELSHNPTLVTKLGDQAHLRATQDFSVEAKVKEYLAYYQKILTVCR